MFRLTQCTWVARLLLGCPFLWPICFNASVMEFGLQSVYSSDAQWTWEKKGILFSLVNFKGTQLHSTEARTCSDSTSVACLSGFGPPKPFCFSVGFPLKRNTCSLYPKQWFDPPGCLQVPFKHHPTKEDSLCRAVSQSDGYN